MINIWLNAHYLFRERIQNTSLTLSIVKLSPTMNTMNLSSHIAILYNSYIMQYYYRYMIAIPGSRCSRYYIYKLLHFSIFLSLILYHALNPNIFFLIYIHLIIHYYILIYIILHLTLWRSLNPVALGPWLPWLPWPPWLRTGCFPRSTPSTAGLSRRHRPHAAMAMGFLASGRTWFGWIYLSG